MTKTLSKTAQKIQDELAEKGTASQVIEFAQSTRTAQEAAERCGCQLGQIVKSLVFKGRKTGKPVLVLTSGANRVDEKRIKAVIGEKIGRADADYVRSVTGLAIGGVAPIGHPQPIDTYIDQDLMAFETVWAAAGTPNAVFEIAPAELKKITNAKVIGVK